MKNYKTEIEAAYMSSLREGNRVRNRGRDQTAHEDRQNRHLNYQQRHAGRHYALEFNNERPDSSMNFTGVNNRGKGPRNYKRPDERIKEIIAESYAIDPYLDASDIEVHVTDGVVLLEGTVSERKARWLAEDLAEEVTGVTEVQNRLRVTEAYRSGYRNNQVNVGLS